MGGREGSAPAAGSAKTTKHATGKIRMSPHEAASLAADGGKRKGAEPFGPAQVPKGSGNPMSALGRPGYGIALHRRPQHTRPAEDSRNRTQRYGGSPTPPSARRISARSCYHHR